MDNRPRLVLTVQMLVLLALLAGIIGFYHYQDYSKDADFRQARLDRDIVQMQLTLDSYLTVVVQDVELVAHSPVLKMYLRSQRPAGRIAEDVFLTLASLRQNYDQLRYLDAFGHERIRVDRRNGHFGLRIDGLEDKSHRDYFQAGSSLSDGDIWLSDMDLNPDQGRAELPHHPMIRAVARVEVDGRQTGMVVLNAKADLLLRRLENVLLAPERLVLLNSDGGWVAGGGSANWQFLADESATLAARAPAMWTNIQSSREGQFEYQGECHFYRWHRFSKPGVQSPRWLIAERLPGEGCSAAATGAVKAGIGWMVGATLFTLPLLLLWHHSRVRANRLRAILDKSYQELDMVTSEAGHGLVMVDRNCLVQWMNPEAERLLGWKEAELINRSLHDITHVLPDGQPLHSGPCPTLQALATGKRIHKDHDRLINRFGDILDLSIRVSPYGEEHSRQAVVAIADVSEHVKLEQQLNRLATTDELTGALNRRSILHTLNLLLCDDQVRPAVLMLDIDHFKKVNDSHGHDAGDRILETFCSTIQKLLRSDDRLARMGGEEFLVVANHIAKKDAQAMAERIRKAIAGIQCYANDGSPISITVSIGVALNHPGESVDALLARADQSLYRAKHKGRNRVELAPPLPENESSLFCC